MSSSKKNFELSKLLPARLKNPTSVSLISNLFDRFLSKDTSQPILGWVGDNLPNSLFIEQPIFDRKVNSLEPVLYTQHGTDEYVTAFKDILDKLEMLGVNLDDFNVWGKAQRFNFAPPISLDKFINFPRYRWIGNILAHKQTPDYNPNMDPEYYVIDWPVIDTLRRLPVRAASTEDLGMLAGNKIVDGIVLKNRDRVLVKNQGMLKENGIYVVNAYDHLNPPRVVLTGNVNIATPGAHKASETKAIVDADTGLIIGIEMPSDVGLGYEEVPSVSFIGGTAGGAAAVAKLDANGSISGFQITSAGAAWTRSEDFDDKNLNVDLSGNPIKEVVLGAFITVIEGATNNNTFWKLSSKNPKVGVDSIRFTEYDGLITDWTSMNYWVHENDIPMLGIDINETTQALRPIIEYDFNLELNTTLDADGKPCGISTDNLDGVTLFVPSKSRFNQAPLFNLYTLDDTPTTENGASTGLVSSVFYYVEDQSYPIDPVMKRRIASPSTAAQDYLFEQGLTGADGQMYFFKKNTVPTSIWAPGPIESPVWVRSAADNIKFIEMPAGPRGDRQSVLDVRVATPARSGQTAVNVALTGLYELDGIKLKDGDLVLVSDQSNMIENGVYVARPGAWDRNSTFSIATSGKVVKVLEGSKSNTYWAVTSPDPLAVGTGPLKLEQINHEIGGAWKIPPQMLYNIEHENRIKTRFGDLKTHMSSILQEQPGFEGSTFGKNNSRTLTRINMGLGGRIRDYNSGFNLLVSLLNQRDISPLSIIDFAQKAYETSLNGVTEFLNLNLADLISKGDVRPISTVNESDEGVLHLLQKYEEAQAARSDLTKIFGDSTSAMTNWPATLPYMGYSATEPTMKFDMELGLSVIVHHDGHESPAFEIDEATVIRLAQSAILRSDGNRTPGTLTAFAPAQPYRNQLWFNTIERQLYVFSVLSDTDTFGDDIAFNAGEKAVDKYKNSNPSASEATLNLIRSNAARAALSEVKANLKSTDYWYKRSTNTLHTWDPILAVWQPIVPTAYRSSTDIIKQAFKKLDLTDLYNSMMLAVEKKLYAGIPERTETRLALSNYANDPARELELASYAAKHNLDMYVTDFNPSDAFTPSDPFTWNYSNAIFGGDAAVALGLKPGLARWHAIYKKFFKSEKYPDGTARPNLEPWVLTNETEDAFRSVWDQTKFGSAEMWTYVRSKWNKPLGVRTTTNELLPPYVSPNDPDVNDGLMHTIPTGISSRYKLGDLGPVELAWSKSLDYNYGLARVSFRKDPAEFLRLCWGSNTAIVNGFQIDKARGKKLSQSELVLHGEEITKKSNNSVDTLFDVEPVASAGQTVTWTFKCIANLPSSTAFDGVNSLGEELKAAVTGELYAFSTSRTSISFKLSNVGLDFDKGDTIKITWVPSTAEMSVEFVPALYKVYSGFGQTYSHLLRYNALDSATALNVSLLRDWTIKLGHRVGGMINTDTLSVKTDAFGMHKSDFKHVVSTNPYFKDTWLEAIRVHVLQQGATALKDGISVPIGDASDWKFRIETYNYHRPQLSYYTLKTDAGANSTNFSILDKSRTDLTWKHYTEVDQLVTVSTPFTISGLQNVINFVYGYAKKLAEDGWRFDNDQNPQIDAETGRSNGMQLEIEKLVQSVYNGLSAGEGAIVNPFLSKVWLKHPVGLMAEMKGGKFIDIRTAPCALDIFSNVIPKDEYRIIRMDDMTEIASDIPMVSVHAMLDSYEHVLVFNQYSADAVSKNLIYDPFLGMRTRRIYLDGKKQSQYNGKPTLDGHFLKGSFVSENIETSVGKILDYYGTDEIAGNSQTSVAAQSLLGYAKKDYFTNIDAPANSQFNFWKGLIHNKGSNLSIDAYLNSAKFKSASIDEYWAYKVATYGDARLKNYPEIKLNSHDAKNRFTVLRFKEVGEELDTMKDGTIIVAPNDEKRWFTIDDVGTVLYFEAQVLGTASGIGIKGQVIDLPVISDDITGATLINSNTAILDESGPYQINCYGPAAPKFSPAKLIDYKDQASMGDVPLWDPARGLHNTRAMEIMDVVDNQDPARYNVSTQTIDNYAYDPLRPWGKDQVGRIWWDTTNRSYLKYYDSKVFLTVNERLNRWGALADWASIDVYEWVASPVPPSEWDNLIKRQASDASVPNEKKASGTPAQPLVFSRDRQWKQRVVAWRYSPNPPEGHNFVGGSGQQRMMLTSNVVGSQTAILNVNRFATFGIASGMSMTALDANGEVYGQGAFSGQPYFVCGKEAATEWQDNAIDPLDSDMFAPITVESSSVTKMGKYIGPVSMSYYTEDGDVYIKATTVLTGMSQYIRIPEDVPAGTALDFDFSDLGIALRGTTKTTASINDIAVNFGSPTYDIYIREVMDFNVEIEFPEEIVNADSYGMSRDSDDGLNYGWAVWTDPTAEQLASDLPSPNNRWEAITGSWVNVDFSTQLLERIKAYDASPLIYSNGSKQDKFSFVWSDWKRSTDYRASRKARVASTPSSPLTIPLNKDLLSKNGSLDLNRLKVYVDGSQIKSSEYKVVDWVLTVTRPVKLGERVMAILKNYAPTAEQLAFDPDVKDDAKVSRQYKIDYEYTSEVNRDTFGNVTSTTYYFWVKDKTSVAPGKSMSVKNAAALLSANTDPYLVLQDYKRESMSYKQVLNDYPPGYDIPPYDIVGQDSDGFDLVVDKILPKRYVTVAINGLSRQVTKDDTYKLRFTKDFTLRNDPNGVDLKNVHTEWMLIRPSQAHRVPEKLWQLLTDAACGNDASGNLIPSLNRVDYDVTNGSSTRFGFESDQALVDKKLALETIKYTILNTSLRRELPGSDVMVPDVITALDFNDEDKWFADSASTRYTLTKIWNEAKPTQVNEIFFAVLNDALANNYEFTDIFKTSMLSAYSIRVLQNELN